MRKIHPLHLRAESNDQLIFVFQTIGGLREFRFPISSSHDVTFRDISPEFIELTHEDMADRCIYNCMGRFLQLRLSGGVKFACLTEKCEPIAIEYKGECREGAFKYLVSLKDAAGSVHTEEVVVSYKDPENALLWSGGQCSFGFDRMAMLEVKDPKPECVDLLNAILQFDQSRYLPSYENEEPMKIVLP